MREIISLGSKLEVLSLTFKFISVSRKSVPDEISLNWNSCRTSNSLLDKNQIIWFAIFVDDFYHINDDSFKSCYLPLWPIRHFPPIFSLWHFLYCFMKFSVSVINPEHGWCSFIQRVLPFKMLGDFCLNEHSEFWLGHGSGLSQFCQI